MNAVFALLMLLSTLLISLLVRLMLSAARSEGFSLHGQHCRLS